MAGKRKRLALLALAMMLMAATPGALAERAVVDNGSDPDSKLNLRSEPNTAAGIVGKFYTGTSVEIVADAGDGWAQVVIGGGSGSVGGYMMTQYLKTGEAARGVSDCARSCQVVSPYGTQSVVLRSRASDSYDAVAMLPVGKQVRAIGTSGDYYYVQLEDESVGCLAADEVR